jgi:outer membrane protein OmpA-like peptidoglycan-associated protein
MKRTKIILLFFMLALLTNVGFSQTKKFKDLFNESFKLLTDDNYIKALPILLEMERMDPKNNNTLFSIGYCYLNSRYDKALAIPYFEKVLSHKNPVSNTHRTGNYKEKKAPIEVIKYLGEAYHFDYQFDKAMENYLMYKDVLSENNTKFQKDINRKIIITKNAQELVQNPVAINVIPLENINTIYPEYRPKVSGNEMLMYFTSRRLIGDKVQQDDQGLYFEDIFFSEKINGQWSEAKVADNMINSVGHDACLYISPDGNYMIIYKANSGAVTYGSIFETYLKNGKWSEPTLMLGDVNSSHWQTDVNLSADGRTMFYTSDRPGGQGGRDLWMVKKLPTGEWGKSQNMGKNINTEFDEEAPYLHPDGKTFYFSSQGHSNMGGHDIFKCELQENGTWGIPVNLGYPANTTGDDVFFFPTNDGKRVYFSSFRKDGKGDQDIYIIEFPNNEEKTLAVYQGVAKDSKGDVLKDLVITVYNADGDIDGVYRPNDLTGRYLFILKPGQTYDVEYKDKGVVAIDKVVVASSGGLQNFIKVATKENDKIVITSGEIVDGEILALIDKDKPDNVEITEIVLNVSENNKDPKKDPIKDSKVEPFKKVVTEYSSQNDMMKDLYFIYDKTKIIEKSVIDYQRTLQYLKDNPTVKLVIEGHTDANGSDEYNLWLASARSNKIKNQLNQDGISWSRMTTKNYGESKPIAPNKNPDGSDNPDGRQINRRVSFVETNKQMAQSTTATETTKNEEVVTISVGANSIEIKQNNSENSYTVYQFGENDLVFKVQLGAFKKKMNESTFDNAEEVGFYKGTDNLYKYFSGTFLSKTMADEHRRRMIAEGFPDAFIVYFQDGKRLTTEEIAVLYGEDCEKTMEVTTNP